MRRRSQIERIAVLVGGACLALNPLPALGQCDSDSQTNRRPLAVISDLHMAFGTNDEKEDFRWPYALRSLLEHINTWGQGEVDLVVAGDFLELWQPRRKDICGGLDADLGCTVEELVEITEDVIAGHPDVFDMLSNWTRRSGNRLHILPGNHDAGLVLDEVQRVVRTAFGAEANVSIEVDGVWRSSDCRIHIEHGHQIPLDANAYDQWPRILDPGTGRVLRPYGERFLQRAFNKVEKEYPLIDNLGPEWRGGWYRATDRGFWASLVDVAGFIVFNLRDTSWRQRGQVVGGRSDGEPAWDTDYVRENGDYRFFAYAMPEGDAMRELLLSETADSQVKRLRGALGAMLQDQTKLTDRQMMDLCSELSFRRAPEDVLCRTETMGHTIASIPGVRAWLLSGHLGTIRTQNPALKWFIYGHTHLLEAPHAVRPRMGGSDLRPWDRDRLERNANVLNTGAFQRVIDDKTYRRLLKQKGQSESRTIDPGQGLRELMPEDLPACYTVALAVPGGEEQWNVDLYRWHMREDGNGRGLIPVGSSEEKRSCYLDY